MGHDFQSEILLALVAQILGCRTHVPRMMAERGGGIRTTNAIESWALCTKSQRGRHPWRRAIFCPGNIKRRPDISPVPFSLPVAGAYDRRADVVFCPGWPPYFSP